MDTGSVLEVTVRALWMSLVLCGPILLVMLVVGLVIGIVQAATSVNESALAFIPKLIAVAIVILVAGPLTLSMFVDYVREVLTSLPTSVR
jgi:flagellar biosynthetic protein FliQ